MNEVIEIEKMRVNYTRTCVTDNPSRVLLFLHGWGGTSRSWDLNIAGLSKKYDCIVVDLPGFGVSSEPAEIWNVADYAKFVKDFAHALGISKFVLVGKSFGGRIAIYYASKWPGSLSHLVLVSSAGVEKKDLITRLEILAAKLIKRLLDLTGERDSERIELALFKAASISKDPDYKWEVKKLVTNTDLTKESSQISVPTLVVWGENDEVLPIKWGKVLNQKIKNSMLRRIPGGHNAHIESAEEFNNLIVAFLTGNGG